MGKTVVGGFSPKTVNLEVLASLKPDVVFAAPGEQGPLFESLARLGIPVVGVEARSFKEVMKAIHVVGNTMGCEDKADDLVKRFNHRIQVVKNTPRPSKHRVFYLLNETPLMTAGPGTFVSELIETAGGENIFSDSRLLYPTVNEEELLKRNPDVIVVPQGSGLTPDVEKLFAKPAWKALTAVKNNRVIWINEDTASRAGPRLADALEELAGKLHR
jgi:iron complex transport system substrate-binding protein